jgi:hypothetical protein
MSPHTRNDAAGQIAMQVEEVFSEIFEAGALSHVIREFIEVAEPEFAVLPIGESNTVHDLMLREGKNPVNAKNRIWGRTRVGPLARASMDLEIKI